jgi:hypothetical protein
MGNKTLLLIMGSLATVLYLSQTKRGTDQLIGIGASLLLAATVQAISSGNQRQLCW